MGRVEPAVRSGGLLKLYQALWAPYYQSVLNILGPTGIVLPLGDPHHGQPNATTFTTKGAEQGTFTWSEAPGSFDTPLDLTDPDSFQGIVPVVAFNGTDEEADTPDAAFWSVDDSGDNGFSMGAWVHVTDAAATRVILSKWSTSASAREWTFELDSSDKLVFRARDVSASAEVNRLVDAAISQSVWVFVVMTYDGAGGVSAMDSVTLYQNGAVAASTATNSGSYEAMENNTTLVGLGSHVAANSPFNGKMAGGPLGPWFVTHDAAGTITADQVRALYDLGRAALGL